MGGNMPNVEEVSSYPWFSEINRLIGFQPVFQQANDEGSVGIPTQDVICDIEDNIEENWRDQADFASLKKNMARLKKEQEKLNARISALNEKYETIGQKCNQLSTDIDELTSLLEQLLDGSISEKEFKKREAEFLNKSQACLDSFADLNQELDALAQEDIDDEQEDSDQEEVEKDDDQPTAYDLLIKQYNEMMKQYERVMEEYNKFSGEYANLDSKKRAQKLKAYNKMLRNYNKLLTIYTENLKAYQEGKLIEQFHELAEAVLEDEAQEDDDPPDTDDDSDDGVATETSVDSSDRIKQLKNLKNAHQHHFSLVRGQLNQLTQRAQALADEFHTALGSIIEHSKMLSRLDSVAVQFVNLCKKIENEIETEAETVSFKEYDPIDKEMLSLDGLIDSEFDRIEDPSFRASFANQTEYQNSSAYKKWSNRKETTELIAKLIFSLMAITFIDASGTQQYDPNDLLAELGDIQKKLNEIGARLGVNWKEEQKHEIDKAEILYGNMLLRAEQAVDALKSSLSGDPAITAKHEELEKIVNDPDMDSGVINALLKDIERYEKNISKLSTSFGSFSAFQKICEQELSGIEEHRNKILNRLELGEIVKYMNELKKLKSGFFKDTPEFRVMGQQLSHIRKILPATGKLHLRAYDSIKKTRNQLVSRASDPLKIDRQLVNEAQGLLSSIEDLEKILDATKQEADAIHEIRENLKASLQNIKKALGAKKFNPKLVKAFEKSIGKTAEVENKALLRGLLGQVQEQESLIQKNKPFNLQLGPPVMVADELDAADIAEINQLVEQLKAEENEDLSEVEQLRNQAISSQDEALLNDAIQLANSCLSGGNQ